MAAKEKGEVRISQRFQAKEKVRLFERVGDWWHPGTVGAGKPAATKTATKDGELRFTGLTPGEPFWAVGDDETRALAVIAKDYDDPGETPAPPVREPDEVREELHRQAVAPQTPPETQE